MLSGKTAVITGASGGIGSACVKLFLEQHAEVFAFIRTKESLAEDRIPKAEGIHFIECDLCSEASIKAAAKELSGASDHIDILVNNAGTVPDSTSFHMTSAGKLRQTFEVNFFGQSILTQYISRMMARNKQGSIVNISSVAAFDGTPGQFEYAASKAAVLGATKELAIELGRYGIRVNAVAPGITKTKMISGMSEELHNNTMDRCIMKREAEPYEIANAVLFLASGMSSYITGQVLRADGGLI